MRVALVRLRVLAMYIIRRFSQGVGRREALRGMKELAGSAEGKIVLVIGNGPSAEMLTPGEVVEQQRAGTLIVIATNHFLASKNGKAITPDFLLWSDDGFHPRARDKHPERWKILEKYPSVTLVMPWTWKRYVDRSNIANPVIYFDNDTLEGWSRQISPLRPRGYQGTTGVKAVAVGTHLSPSQTQVIGLDLSYVKNFSVGPDNTVTRNPTHVPGTDSGEQDMTRETLVGMADLLYSTANEYRALHTHFSNKNIVNLDPHSLVDAFPKIKESRFIAERNSG